MNLIANGDQLARSEPLSAEELEVYGPVAMSLAPDEQHYKALLRGESIPVAVVSPEMMHRFGRRPGVLPSDRIAVRDLNTVMAPVTNGNSLTPFAMPLDDFLDVELEHPAPLLGTMDDTLIPRGGLVVVAGQAGVGKTTLLIDLVFHLASGMAWLEQAVEKPLSILLVENEGPQHKFQQKLQRKKENWEGDPNQGGIHIQTWRWGAFSFGDSESVEQIAHYLEFWDVDIVVGDPLDTLGVQGVGSPADTREFVKLLVPLGLTQTRTFVFLHHLRKEESAEEINQVAGAWGGRLDSLMFLKGTDDEDKLRLSFPKLRWAESRRPLILGKNNGTFDLVGEEKPKVEVSDDAIQEMLVRILDVLKKRAEPVERMVLALACETSTNAGTFTRAIKRGVEHELIASAKVGRKTEYSLTGTSWEL